MFDRATRLRWRRKFRRSKKQVEGIGQQAEVGVEKHFFKRVSRLAQVRRFIASWVVLFVLLIGGVLYQTRSLGAYYLSPQPAAGGIYNEGILGSFTNANPIYAASSVDNSVVELVFAGLFTFDANNNLVGELAKSWKVDARGLNYTVTLKPDLTWHDGQPLTSADVVYTYNMIKNPDAKSPLASSWQGIKVKAKGPNQVVFSLPNILSSFPYSMVNGLLPKHLLDGVPASQLRSVTFNTKSPIGSGPFKWEAVEVIGATPEEREQRIALEPFEGYANGKPAIDKFLIRTFNSEEKLASALKARQIDGAAGLTTVPENLRGDSTLKEYNIPLTSQVNLFFKNTVAPFDEVNVRRALSYATDTKAIVDNIARPVGAVQGPLLKGQIGYSDKITQKVGNQNKAKDLLDKAGWRLGQDGLRQKKDKTLSFTLTTQENSTFDFVAQQLKKQWAEIGVNVDIIQQKDSDLQSALTVHNYDTLLYGIAIGPDPDVFAYWHSSQADLRSPNSLNFSEYSSAKADRSLEAGRTREDNRVRSVKYKPFLEAWTSDAPAVAIYQPRYLYLVREPLFNFSHRLMNNGSDRLNDVSNWMVRREQQPVKY
jgi:peptide/nickel transport system substrate-binding protein